jgi:hypothetical protein
MCVLAAVLGWVLPARERPVAPEEHVSAEETLLAEETAGEDIIVDGGH